MSKACFRTSKELFEHYRSTHRNETDKIFRCGLEGCQKSWKVLPMLIYLLNAASLQSLNGLQYHLQVYAFQLPFTLADVIP